MVKKIIIKFNAGTFSSSEREAYNLHSKSFLGQSEENKIIFSDYETLYLLDKQKAEILDLKNKEINKISLIKKLSKKNKEIKNNYLVFKDLSDKGYILKTGLKFGAEFRAYEKKDLKKISKSILEKSHAKYLVFVQNEKQKINWHDFCAKHRVAHSSGKLGLVAIVDSENSITYYVIDWEKI